MNRASARDLPGVGNAPPPDDSVCLARGYDRDCPRVECSYRLPPVAGDITRRRATCLRAVLDVSDLRGGLSLEDVAWLTGMPKATVSWVEHRALAKLRRRLEEAPRGAA